MNILLVNQLCPPGTVLWPSLLSLVLLSLLHGVPRNLSRLLWKVFRALAFFICSGKELYSWTTCTLPCCWRTWPLPCRDSSLASGYDAYLVSLACQTRSLDWTYPSVSILSYCDKTELCDKTWNPKSRGVSLAVVSWAERNQTIRTVDWEFCISRFNN